MAKLKRKHTRRRFSRTMMSVNVGNEKFWMEANQIADVTDDGFKATNIGI
uniref:Uncharacterized protein n=1 Tax=Aegilops tauschii TaxID=37682 RepID=M8CF76_AEGTA